MGWQEYPENDESCLPLTEDELKEFHMKTEQVCHKPPLETKLNH
jgi:hypothetical protein